MKSLIAAVFMSGGVLVFSSSLSIAVEVSSAVVVSAEVGGIARIELQVRSEGTGIAVSSVSWENQIVGSGWQKARNYIEVDIDCNYPAWSMDIYTNNISAAAGFQKGGLLSTTQNTARIQVAWMVSDSTVPAVNAGEPGELIKSTITTKNGTVDEAWKYLKDKGDTDDPSTTAWNESWSEASGADYTRIHAGTNNRLYLSCGEDAASPAVVYLEGDFYSAEGNMKYESTIWVDLAYQ